MVANRLHDDLCANYELSRQRPREEEWPPDQPSSIVNLALIHYHNRRTQQELIEISKRCKEGASHVDRLTASNSNVTKDIQKIFMPECGNKSPKRILIEGAPGIGKTVLAKEIAYQWANGRILQEYKLLFLLYLRDPKLHEVKSISDMLDLFKLESADELEEYVTESYGENAAFVFDGFDEFPITLQKHSFITDFIKGTSMFLNSAVVVTSRPTATLFLHGIVDRRIEILGFPKEERQKYVSLSLRDSLDKIQELDKYLKQHPIIDNLCYIPLHLAILMYLFQQDSLPETLTEMNEFFIINTIYRYMERNRLNTPSVVNELTDFPNNIVEFIYKLSKLAFKGLQNNQLVFAFDEIKKVCPEVDTTPGAINGFGLLQAVQHYPKRGAGRTTSVNFLHFTMQEYLSALHVSSLSNENQLSMMRKTFWDGQFSFMWMMYVGIVGVKSSSFTSFIDSYDTRECLHLFQCYMEAKSNVEMPKAVSSIFADGKITLNGITLLPHHISSLLFFMSASSVQQWKVLALGGCNLRDIGMNSLMEHIVKNDENISALEYVDLSGNSTSPWGVYCAIIRHCCVRNLTLCGDEGMKTYVKDMTDSLQMNKMLQSLTLCASRHNVGRHEDMVDQANNTKRLQSILVFDSKLYFSTLFNGDDDYNDEQTTDKRVVNVKVLYDDDNCSPETISLSNKTVNDDTVCLVTFGLYENKTVKKLDLSCNNVTDDGVIIIGNCLKHNTTLNTLDISQNKITDNAAQAISDCLKQNTSIQTLDISHNKITDDGAVAMSCCLEHNTTIQKLNISHNKITNNGATAISHSLKHNSTLKELNLSWNHINFRGMSNLSESIKYAKSLEYVDLSGNWSSLWSLYCAIIKNCSGNSLTVCGDQGMKDCVKEIIDSLQTNTILQSLTLCKMGRIGMEIIECIVASNTTLKQLNLSWGKNANGTKVIKRQMKPGVHVNILYDDYHECLSKIISLSNKNINDDAVYVIAFGLYSNLTVEKLDLSHNNITANGMNRLSECVKHAVSLEYVDLSENKSSQWGVYCAIIRYCCVKTLTLCGDEGAKFYVKEITNSLKANTVLQSLSIYINDVGRYENTVVKANDKSRPQNVLFINSKVCFSMPANDDEVTTDEKVVHIKILSDGDSKSLPDAINLSSSNVSDDAVSLITFGLYNNTVIKKLDLLSNSITDHGAVIISGYLKHNTILQKLDISHNKITDDGAVTIGDSLKHNKTLKQLNLSHNLMNTEGIIILSECIKYTEYVDLSGNKSSPWGGYCTIIKHCCVNNLTLFGDEGLKHYVKDIKDSLRMNTTLHSLTLCAVSSNVGGYKDTVVESDNMEIPQSILVIDGKLYFNSPRVVNDVEELSNTKVVNIKIYDNDGKNSSEAINLSHKDVKDDTIGLVMFGLYNNTSVKTLDLSHNCITDDGAIIISDSLKHNTQVEKLDISCNKITSNGILAISDCLKHNTTIQELDVSHNKIADNGAMVIGDCLKHNTTLQKLDISQNLISDNGAVVISESLKHNSILKELNLSQNDVDIRGMSYLSENIRYTTSLEYVDLSGNKSSPWGVYCIVIRHCYVNSLTLCGDEGIKQYINDVIDSLQASSTLKSLTLCKIGSTGMRSIESILVNNPTLKELNLSWGSNANGINIVERLYKRQLKLVSHNDNEVCVKILYDGHHECLSETIDLSNKNIDDNAVYVIAFGLHNNITVKKLDLSLNSINVNGMNELSQCVKVAISLNYLDLSGNKLSPWSVYCAVIRHCCTNSLTLCGDERMNEYVKEISDSLQNNATLQSLTLCKIGRVGIQSMKDVLSENTTLKELNVSWISKGTKKIINRKLLGNVFDNTKIDSNSFEWAVDLSILYDDDYHKCSSEAITLSGKGINDDAVHIISFGLYNNTVVQALDLSCNNITNDGAVAISDCIRSNCSLKTLILSKNSISYKGAEKISELIQVNEVISVLNISCNVIHDIGVIVICDSLKANNTLKELNLSDNQITSKGARKIAEAIGMNKALLRLDISHNVLRDDGVMYISDGLKNNNTLLELNLSECDINNKGGKNIANGIQQNIALQKLDLSHNNISDDGVIVISDYLKRNKTLKELNLSNTNVSEEGLKIIAQAMYSSEYDT